MKIIRDIYNSLSTRTAAGVLAAGLGLGTATGCQHQVGHTVIDDEHTTRNNQGRSVPVYKVFPWPNREFIYDGTEKIYLNETESEELSRTPAP